MLSPTQATLIFSAESSARTFPHTAQNAKNTPRIFTIFIYGGSLNARADLCQRLFFYEKWISAFMIDAERTTRIATIGAVEWKMNNEWISAFMIHAERTTLQGVCTALRANPILSLVSYFVAVVVLQKRYYRGKERLSMPLRLSWKIRTVRKLQECY